MLDKLQRLVEAVGSARNLDEALGIIVARVKEAMAVDVCSAYLDQPPEGDLVLMATDGLAPSAVGKVRLRPHEGLVGLVAERREPVNLSDAFSHPRFRYFPETGEDRYHSFLGAPIVHYRQVLGVLVVQQVTAREFHSDEVAFLITVAAQVAGALHVVSKGAAATRTLQNPSREGGFIQGVGGAPGVCVGTVALAHPMARLAAVPDKPVTDTDAEVETFRAAVKAVREEMRAIGKRMDGALPSAERALFDVYVMLLGSKSLVADTVRRIRGGNWGPGAWRDTILEHARVFEQMEDPYLRTRAEDIRGIGQRILLQLQQEPRGPRAWPNHSVLVGEEITVADMAAVPREKLAGVLSFRGSALSHTAVLARGLDIPAVMGIGDLPPGQIEGATIVVDGYQGRVFIRPSRTVLTEFRRLIRDQKELQAGLQELRDLPAETRDGVRIPLYVNTGLLSDINPARDSGAEGVGLYRTELPFMVRQSFPTEEDQYVGYCQVLEPFAPRPVTMRTLDVGGDKPLPYFAIVEDNPYLGWRGIRLTLDHPELFLTQFRALLRAHARHGNLKLLLPMVSTVSEVDEALLLLRKAHHEICEEGCAVPLPEVGVMVEVPSAVFQTSALARRVDFISVGTNDLTQYLLAVDRNNPRVAPLYDGLHPAVIQAVAQVVRDTHAIGKTVSVCGELAGDPAGALLFLGMGIDNLSLATSALPRIKWLIRSFTATEARSLLAIALTLEDPDTIRALLHGAIEQAGLGSLIGPSR